MHKTNRVWDVLVLWPVVYIALAVILVAIISFLTNNASTDEALGDRKSVV